MLKVALNIIKQTIYQNCPRPEYSWNTARWTLRNNESPGVAQKSFTASTMLIRFSSYLLYFDIQNDVCLHTRDDGWHTWHSNLFKVSGLALNYFLLIFFLYYSVQLIDKLLFNVKCFSCVHNKTLYTPCVFCLYKSFILTNVPTKVVSSNPVHGEMYSIQHYVIKFVSDLRQVGAFLRVLRFPPPIKSTATI